MKRVITTVILLMLMGAAGFAQTSKRIYTTDEKVAEEQARIKADPELAAKAKADAKALKAIQKKIQAAIDSVAAAKAVNALDSLNFVMEVDRLAGGGSNLGELLSSLKRPRQRQLQDFIFLIQPRKNLSRARLSLADRARRTSLWRSR